MRPKEFDEREVLELLMQTFWHKGYSGTSLQDLEIATGLSRPSIYNCFGKSKLEIFEQVLEHYIESVCDCWLNSLLSAPTAREGVATFFHSFIDTQSSCCAPNGCLLVLTASEQSCCGDWCAGLVQNAFKRVEQELRTKLRQGVESGELNRNLNVDGVASTLVCLIQGLAVKHRAGAKKAQLRKISETALTLLS